MKKGSFSVLSVILLISLVLTAAGALLAWRLFPIPFGRLFEWAITATTAGLVLFFGVLAFMALRSRKVWLKAAGFVPVLLALALASVGIILKTDYRLLPGLSYRYGLTAEQWQEDVRFFAEEFPKRHVRLYEMVDLEKFEAAAKSLEERVPGLSETEIKDGLYRLAALPNDAHSYPNIFTHKLDWHALPFKMWLFDDGVYILDAGREHRGLIGSRLAEIEGVTVREAYERLRPALSHENEFGWKERFLYPLGVAEFLEAEGIVDDPGRIEMTFEFEDGTRITTGIEPYHYIPVLYWSSLSRVGNDTPHVITNDREDNWRFEYLEDSGTLYLQFNACLGKNGEERIEDFVARLGEWVEQNDFDRFVCDIRANGGGDAYVSRQIAGLIIGNGKIDRAGRLFMLTSRRTFSAAVMFLSLIENNTKAVIVGEPPGQGPFFCGEPRPIALANSGLQINVSSHYNRCSLFEDGRESIMPDLPVEYTAKDYFKSRDPVMAAVLQYRAPVVASGELDAETVERYSGRYRLSPYQILTVERTGESLRFRVDDFFEGSWRNVGSDLYPSGPDLFGTGIDGVELSFSRGPDGRAEGAVLRWRGIDAYAERAADGYKVPMELFAEGRVAEAANALYDQRETYKREIPDLESRLNGMGYSLLGEKKDGQAVTVLKLNTKLFPESANTFDSLGEAYLLSGDIPLAIANYEKALELNPKSENARQMLEHLRRGDTWDRDNDRWIG